MCGITGFVGEGDAGILVAMRDALRHRGPDGAGAWSDVAAGVFLGHRRLAILDHGGGHQPMATSDGDLVVVFNGEIYNHRALRRELEAAGHVFVSDHSDTEVLLHGWRAWGTGLDQRLDGMWAYALYDRSAGRLVCSRDRFGEKPLLWTRQNGVFAFASEAGALRQHPRLAFASDDLSLAKYLAYGYVPSPRTPWQRVAQLEPGCRLTLDCPSGAVSTERWWSFVLEPEPPRDGRELRARTEELQAHLLSAVAGRVEADVPLGVFLSGGIDSSAVSAAAVRAIGRDRLHTFSIGFEDPSFDERRWAERMAGHLGCRHRAEILAVDAGLAALADLRQHLDLPLADSSLPATWLLARETRRHVTVALGGDGADELFAGYDPFKALRLAAAWAKLVPRPVHAAVRLLAARLPVSHRNLSLEFKLKRTLAPLDRRPALWPPVWLGPVHPERLGAALGVRIDEEELFSEAIACWDGCGSDHPVDRVLQFFTRLYLSEDILLKVDRCSMRHSLEVRAPFLANAVVDCARRLPWWCKFRRGSTKWLLKRALAPLVPAEILYRRKKGFGSPIGRWFQAGALDLDPAGVSGIQPGFLAERLAAHRAGREDERLLLMAAWLAPQ